MAEKKLTAMQKLAMDIGRGCLLTTIPYYRAKKIYTGGEETKAAIKSLERGIIAANHTGFSDPILLNSCFWYRRFFYVASEEVMAGFRGKLLTAAGCIKIDRRGADIKAINRCAFILKEGNLLGMFPEGTIGGGAAKGGILLIAAMSDAPIVPTYIRRRTNIAGRHIVVFDDPFKVSDFCDSKLPCKKDIDLLLGILDDRIEKCKELAESI